MFKQISIAELKPGMVITRIISQNGPVRIRKSGLVTGEAMVDGLREMGVLELEVDPHQQVELEDNTLGPKNVTSPTQALFNVQSPSAPGLDKTLSEQFNRSLFLPSVQSIKPEWQWLAQQSIAFVVLALLGFALGFVGAHVPGWLKTQMNPPIATQQQATSSPADVVENTPSEPEGGETKVDSLTEDISTQQEAAVPSNAQQQDTTASAQPLTDKTNEEVTLIQQQEPVAQPDPFAPPEEGQDAFSRSQQFQQENNQISPELLQRFQNAVSEVKPATEVGSQRSYNEKSQDDDNVIRIDQLPAWVLTELPSMSFSAHMYASEPGDRWVRVNGNEKVEGDMIADKVQIQRIEPQRVILVYRGEEFSMAALTDW